MSDGNPSAGGTTRASDSDRERMADELRAHAVAGRLDTDELEQRVAAAYRARTIGELSDLRRDLPATPEALALAHRERRGQLMRRSVQQAGASAGAFAVCAVIWAVSSAHRPFWPAWVLIPVVMVLARTGWDLFGPGADLDVAERRLDAHADRHADRDTRRRDRRLERRER